MPLLLIKVVGGWNSVGSTNIPLSFQISVVTSFPSTTYIKDWDLNLEVAIYLFYEGLCHFYFYTLLIGPKQYKIIFKK